MRAIYPGSFDPITKGHLDIIRRALAFCSELVIAVGVSASKQGVFTPEERQALIHEALADTFSSSELSRLQVTSYSGATVHLAERYKAGLIVKGLRNPADYADEQKMAIVNRRLTREIDTVFLMTENDLRDVSSSAVREMARIGIPAHQMDHYLTPSVRDQLLARLAPSSA